MEDDSKKKTHNKEKQQDGSTKIKRETRKRTNGSPGHCRENLCEWEREGGGGGGGGSWRRGNPNTEGARIM